MKKYTGLKLFIKFFIIIKNRESDNMKHTNKKSACNFFSEYKL
jgi:hypothetical protein